MTDNVLPYPKDRKRVGEIRLLALPRGTGSTCTAPTAYTIRRRAASAVLAQRARWAQLETIEAVPVDRAPDADPNGPESQLPPDHTLDVIATWSGYVALAGTAYLVLRIATDVICR